MNSIYVAIKNELTGQEYREKYAVNREFEGLFVLRGGAYSQLAGCGQFRASNPRELMRKLRRVYQEPGVQTIRMVRGSASWN